ncbi:MAG: hypothetical protein EBT90_12120 [Rhodobacteraceae bacterium]|jgi:hypothetical protein|nr:hypothetical protein [Paracoccaceae bacterium]
MLSLLFTDEVLLLPPEAASLSASCIKGFVPPPPHPASAIAPTKKTASFFIDLPVFYFVAINAKEYFMQTKVYYDGLGMKVIQVSRALITQRPNI